MRKLLFLISSLDYGGSARRLGLLARGLARAGQPPRICVLETKTPWAAALRQAGLDVDVLGWRRPIDVQPFFALRRLLQEQRPDLVHAFGPIALRAVQVCGLGRLPLVASDLLHGGRPAAGWTVDRWLLRNVLRIVAFSTADALRYQRLGVAAERIGVVTQGVEPYEDAGAADGWPAGRVILAVGPIEAHKGFRDAVWAYDILHYLFDDLRLAFVGTGPDVPRIQEFVRAVGAAPFVSFLGKQEHIEPYYRRAAVVWVPSRTGGGAGAALEALAASRPVVATSVPELAEIIDEGATGFLVPPGTPAILARQTRLLLGDENLARRLADAGKQRVLERHSAARMVAEYAAICERSGG